MKLDVIEQDQVTRAQAGNEQVFNVQLEDLRVNGPVYQHGGADAVHAQGADHREVAAVVEGFAYCRPFASRGTSGGTGHRQVDAEFAQKNQLFPSQRLLVFLERGPLVGLGLGGALGLFFRVNPSACNLRQIVLRLTSTRTFFFNCSRSSSSVASGVAATRADKEGNCSAASSASAPPPCGSGARSPRSRF